MKATITKLAIAVALTAMLGVFIACDDGSGDNNNNNGTGGETEKFEVSFESNGGSAVPVQNKGNGEKVNKPDVTKEGHILEGWYTDAAFTAKWDFDKDTVTQAMTLYAKWTSFNEVDFGIGVTVDNTFDVANAEQWNTALSTISTSGNDKKYVINVTADFAVAGIDYMAFGMATGISVSLRGKGRTVSLSSAGNLLRINANQTVILWDVTLQGIEENNASLVYVDVKAFLTMNSGKISGNTNTIGYSGGGVYVASESPNGGTFTMNGGEISGNANVGGGGGGSTGVGGGVLVSTWSSFTMNGGTISGNTVDYLGGGICLYGADKSIMNGGTISGNTAYYGGGVYVYQGTFRIVTGTIYGSDAEDETLRNNVTGAPYYGAALDKGNSASIEYGANIDGAWSTLSTWTYADSNKTTIVLDGVLQQEPEPEL